MQIVRNRAVVNDPWRHLPDDVPLGIGATHQSMIVSLARWQRDRQALLACGTDLGVRLHADDALEPIAGDLNNFKVIALTFGMFTDGRGYSQARLLRQRYGYRGELRARGDFLPDQVAFLERCGFDAFEIPTGQDIEQTLKAFSEISVTYQPAADTEELIFHRRQRSLAPMENR